MVALVTKPFFLTKCQQKMDIRSLPGLRQQTGPIIRI